MRDHDHQTFADHGLHLTESGFADWDKQHAEYPRNWSMKRKIYDTTIITSFEFYATLISTTGTVAASYAMEELQLSRTLAILVFTSVYQIGQAIGCLVMPPLSESYGRRKPYLYSCTAFAIGNLIAAVVPSTYAGVVVGRFISGLVSAVPTVVIGGSIEDLYEAEARIWLIFAWNTSANAALAIGPIYASYIAASAGWRWIYYIGALVCACLVVALLFIRESRPSKLLVLKTKSLRRDTDQNSLRVHDSPDTVRGAKQLINAVVVRPTRLGLTEPICIMVSMLSATACGLIYLFSESFSVVYEQFGWAETTTSLPFVAIMVGFLPSWFLRQHDLRIMRARQEKAETSIPEDGLMGFAFAAPSLAIGLWIFAWTIPPLVTIHWMVSMLGLIFIGFALNEVEYTLSAYLAEAYTVYASSALAAMGFGRAIVSGGLPLFAHQMFVGLGANVAGSIIAAVATLFCITPVLFLHWGKTMREKSPFARFSVKVNQESSVA